MKVGVIGVGYVGLVTGTCLAKIGHRVWCADIDAKKIGLLNEGHLPIYEPGLDELVSDCREAVSIEFGTDIDETVKRSDVLFICVGTPSDMDGSADLSYVKDVAAQIGAAMDRYKVVVNKSTVPVGSTVMVERIIEENLEVPREFDVVSNPEFLREGSAIEDFFNPDRIVIGSTSQKAIGLMTELYQPIKAPLVITDPASAELIKYASNAFLATKVSFVNAISNVCDCVGADIKEVALGMGYDKRIGFDFLKAGPGWGGSCFPKDTRALIKIAEDAGYDFELLKGVSNVNEEQRKRIVHKLDELMGGMSGKRIAALGLAFKPNTDDIRESPAIDIIRMVTQKGARAAVFDPVALDNAKAILADVDFCDDPYEAVKGADGLIILTEWDEFKWLDWVRIRADMLSPVIFDARNCIDPQGIRQLGFIYKGVGR